MSRPRPIKKNLACTTAVHALHTVVRTEGVAFRGSRVAFRAHGVCVQRGQVDYAVIVSTPQVLALVVAGACAACAASGRPVPTRRLGGAMAELGTRFERAGKAVLANRWDLANYDIAELGEVVEHDWTPASWKGNDKVADLANAFATRTLPALQMTVRGRDRDAAARVFADTARACNGCHQAAGVGFIEVPEALGAASPVLDPK